MLMKTGDQQRVESTEWVIPSPWEGPAIGGFIGFLFLFYFNPVFTVAGVFAGAIVGGLWDHYHRPYEAWYGVRPDNQKDGVNALTAVGLGAGGLALVALPFIVIFDL